MNKIYEKEGIKGFCPNCDSFKKGKIVKRKIETVVKGVTVEAVIEELYCNDCSELLTSDEIDKRNDIVIFNEYKKAVGLLTTFEIKSIRTKRRMSQEQMADFLAIGAKDIARYENGSIQTKNIDMMIRMIDDDIMFRSMCMKFNKMEYFNKSCSVHWKNAPYISILNAFENNPVYFKENKNYNDTCEINEEVRINGRKNIRVEACKSFC